MNELRRALERLIAACQDETGALLRPTQSDINAAKAALEKAL